MQKVVAVMAVMMRPMGVIVMEPKVSIEVGKSGVLFISGQLGTED